MLYGECLICRQCDIAFLRARIDAVAIGCQIALLVSRDLLGEGQRQLAPRRDTITVNMMQWKRRGGREVIIAPAGGGAWAAPGQGVGRAYADKTTPHVYVIDGDAGSSLHGRDRRQADDRPGRR